MIVFKLLAIVVGAVLAATSAYALVAYMGGIETVAAKTVAAMALGVVAGSIAIGTIASRGVAVIILLAMLSGEAYSFAGTAERIMAARAAQQAPLRDAAARHAAAVEALQAAKTAKPTPASRERLEAAVRAQASAVEAVRAQANTMGCKANCAALLQGAVDTATRELGAARDEVAAHDATETKRIVADVEAAQAELDRAPLPPSVSPFADKLGVEPSTLDLIMAALLSLGLNGMAAALIGTGAHGLRKELAPTPPVASKPRLVTSTALSVIDFGANALEASPGSKLDFEEFSVAYDRAAQAVK
jgi:hypothetical protein